MSLTKRLALLLVVLLLSVPCVFGQGVGQRGTTSVGFAPNETSTGTTQYLLAKIVAGKAIKALTTDTAIPLYVVVSSTAITGDAVYVVAGTTSCVMDATNASGMSNLPVVASVTTAGRCHVQASLPAAGWIVGTMVDDATTSGSLGKINGFTVPSFPAAGAGSGTVTSAALSMPAEFTVSGSPVTTAGTLTATKANAATNCVMAGPASGGAAPWACRGLVAADLPGGGSPPTGTAAGDLGGTYPNPTVLKASGVWALTGDTTPTTLTGDLNDANLAGFTTNSVIRIDGGAVERIITGLVATARGDIKIIKNVGTQQPILFPNENANSTAVNRFHFPGDISLLPGDAQPMQYDTTLNRWTPFGPAALHVYRWRPCNLGAGSPDPSAAPLSATDALNEACPNDYGRDLELMALSCRANNTGVVITPILTGGSSTSILTGPLTCGNATWADGTVQTTRPVLHTYSGTGNTCAVTPCSMAVTWTTTGLASEVQIKIRMRLK
jgi:hypothetical protein